MFLFLLFDHGEEAPAELWIKIQVSHIVLDVLSYKFCWKRKYAINNSLLLQIEINTDQKGHVMQKCSPCPDD